MYVREQTSGFLGVCCYRTDNHGGGQHLGYLKLMSFPPPAPKTWPFRS